MVSQSGAIIRYIAKLAGLVPTDEALLMDAEMLVELANDMNDINPITVFHAKGSEAQLASLAKFMASAQDWLAAASRLLAGKPFFGGDVMMYGDFALLPVIDNLVLTVPTALEGIPELAAWFARCLDVEKVAAYRAARPAYGLPGSVVNPVA